MSYVLSAVVILSKHSAMWIHTLRVVIGGQEWDVYTLAHSAEVSAIVDYKLNHLHSLFGTTDKPRSDYYSYMPEKVDDCVDSVLESNPEMSEERAFAICQAQENEGELSDVNFDKELQEEDPCESGYTMVGTKQQNGQTVPNCVPVEETGELEPPNLQASAHILSGSRQLAGQIERKEVDDDIVRYNNIKALTSGV